MNASKTQYNNTFQCLADHMQIINTEQAFHHYFSNPNDKASFQQKLIQFSSDIDAIKQVYKNITTHLMTPSLRLEIIYIYLSGALDAFQSDTVSDDIYHQIKLTGVEHIHAIAQAHRGKIKHPWIRFFILFPETLSAQPSDPIYQFLMCAFMKPEIFKELKALTSSIKTKKNIIKNIYLSYLKHKNLSLLTTLIKYKPQDKGYFLKNLSMVEPPLPNPEGSRPVIDFMNYLIDNLSDTEEEKDEFFQIILDNIVNNFFYRDISKKPFFYVMIVNHFDQFLSLIQKKPVRKLHDLSWIRHFLTLMHDNKISLQKLKDTPFMVQSIVSLIKAYLNNTRQYARTFPSLYLEDGDCQYFLSLCLIEAFQKSPLNIPLLESAFLFLKERLSASTNLMLSFTRTVSNFPLDSIYLITLLIEDLLSNDESPFIFNKDYFIQTSEILSNLTQNTHLSCITRSSLHHDIRRYLDNTMNKFFIMLDHEKDIPQQELFIALLLLKHFRCFIHIDDVLYLKNPFIKDLIQLALSDNFQYDTSNPQEDIDRFFQDYQKYMTLNSLLPPFPMPLTALSEPPAKKLYQPNGQNNDTLVLQHYLPSNLETSFMPFLNKTQRNQTDQDNMISTDLTTSTQLSASMA